MNLRDQIIACGFLLTLTAHAICGVTSPLNLEDETNETKGAADPNKTQPLHFSLVLKQSPEYLTINWKSMEEVSHYEILLTDSQDKPIENRATEKNYTPSRNPQEKYSLSYQFLTPGKYHIEIRGYATDGGIQTGSGKHEFDVPPPTERGIQTGSEKHEPDVALPTDGGIQAGSEKLESDVLPPTDGGIRAGSEKLESDAALPKDGGPDSRRKRALWYTAWVFLACIAVAALLFTASVYREDLLDSWHSFWGRYRESPDAEEYSHSRSKAKRTQTHSMLAGETSSHSNSVQESGQWPSDGESLNQAEEFERDEELRIGSEKIYNKLTELESLCAANSGQLERISRDQTGLADNIMEVERSVDAVDERLGRTERKTADLDFALSKLSKLASVVDDLRAEFGSTEDKLRKVFHDEVGRVEKEIDQLRRNLIALQNEKLQERNAVVVRAIEKVKTLIDQVAEQPPRDVTLLLNALEASNHADALPPLQKAGQQLLSALSSSEDGTSLRAYLEARKHLMKIQGELAKLVKSPPADAEQRSDRLVKDSEKVHRAYISANSGESFGSECASKTRLSLLKELGMLYISVVMGRFRGDSERASAQIEETLKHLGLELIRIDVGKTKPDSRHFDIQSAAPTDKHPAGAVINVQKMGYIEVGTGEITKAQVIIAQ